MAYACNATFRVWIPNPIRKSHPADVPTHFIRRHKVPIPKINLLFSIGYDLWVKYITTLAHSNFRLRRSTRPSSRKEWLREGKPVNLPADPEKGVRRKCPLEIAIESGFHSLFQLLLQYHFFTDLVSDHRGVSFHRFQIAVWTLVLGIIFVLEVIDNLKMPEFSDTLLALMGD